MLRKGSKGTAVIALQQKLRDLHLYHGLVDGIFGLQTERSVLSFQKARGFAVDGIVGPITATALQRAHTNPGSAQPGPPHREKRETGDGYYIDIQHYLYKDGERVQYVQAHDHSGPMKADPQVFVVHYDAGRQNASVGILTRKDNVYISAQFSLGANAFPIQMLPAAYTAWHAGDGDIAGLNYHGKSLNYTATGVECENLGWLNKSGDGFAWREEMWRGQIAHSPKVPIADCVFGPHSIRGGEPMWWPRWPKVQVDDLRDLIRAWITRYPSAAYLVGHDEVSPVKFDPGLAFEEEWGGMDALRKEFDLRGVK